MATKAEHEREWARDDARISNEFARHAAQAAILINGGAATAILAFLSNASRDNGNLAVHLLPYMPIALGAYAFGVFLAAVALAVGSKALELFMMAHESRQGSYGDKGVKWWNLTVGLIVLGLGCFVVSSFVLAFGFWNLTDA